MARGGRSGDTTVETLAEGKEVYSANGLWAFDIDTYEERGRIFQ